MYHIWYSNLIRTKNIEIFANAFQKLNTNYVDEIDPSELMRIGIDAMVSSLDPYTNYISESQIEPYRLANEGKYLFSIEIKYYTKLSIS